MKKLLATIGIALVIAVALWVGVFLWKNFRGLAPAFLPPKQDIANLLKEIPETQLPSAENKTEFPLTLPDGFSISVLAKNLPGARVLAFDSNGNLWVSQTKEGKVSQIIIENGKNLGQTVRISGLKNPHGLAFDPENKNVLFIATETAILKTDVLLRSITLSTQKVLDLPKGGRHFTRTLGFGPDGRLYVSIGSTCDVCYEQDERFASVYSLNKDGSDFKQEARGLRNSVFFTWDRRGQMWATEMGRDNLGDNLPPDEINIVKVSSAQSASEQNQQLEVADFGWPICYGQNIHDSKFDTNIYIQNPCTGKLPAAIDLPAHSAPLGLAFVAKNAGWPKEYEHNLLVAFHGSWNRSEPTGYKISRLKLDSQGEFLGMEDFVFGWLKDSRSLGRPVDLVFGPKGSLFVSDDKAGVVYELSFSQPFYDELKVSSPKAGQSVDSPVQISGLASGSWFFEGSFPVEVISEKGEVLGQGIAKADGEWMTSELVPFQAEVKFQVKGQTGFLVLKNDNPSGLSENQKTFRLPIKFK